LNCLNWIVCVRVIGVGEGTWTTG